MWTLISWNVLADAYVRPSYFPSVAPGMLLPGARTAAIVARLRACDADVVCLQEVEPGALDAIGKGLGERYVVAHAPKRGGKPDGCAVLVRGPALHVTAVRELIYDDGRPPSGHVALIAEIDAGDRPVGIATTHLRWDAPATPAADRLAPRQIGELLAATVAGPGATRPWLLCGDFNLGSDDPAFAAFTAAGCVDAYEGSIFATPTSVANGRARRIDFVLHHGALPVRPLPIPPIDERTVLPSAEHPSDHLIVGVAVDG